MDGLGSREAPEGQVLAPTAHCSKHRKVQAGATLSYTDNGDGTITDNNTGLMWEKKTGVVRVPLGSDANERTRALQFLLSRGLIQADKEETGGRPRTTYRAT